MKKYSVFGDSISTFRGVIPSKNRWFYDADDTYGTGVCDPDETWWGRAIRRNGGKLVANASFSGSMVEGWGFPAGCSKERAAQIIGEDGSVPDIVLVYIGINDFGWGSPEAQAAGGSVASPANYDICGLPINKPSDIDGVSADILAVSSIPSVKYENASPTAMAPENAVDRFQMAYTNMLENIRSVAPNAEIHCLTLSPARIVGKRGHFCHSLRGHTLDEYNKAIKRACENTGAICADIRAFNLDYSSIDGTHPDLVGMRQIASMYLASMGVKDALDDYESDMASASPIEELAEDDRRKLISDSGWSCLVIDE